MARMSTPPRRSASAPSRMAAPPKVADEFYHSPEWIALRRRRMKDADYREAKARAKDGERVVLDHVIERRDGGADLDPNNTVWLTFSEHQAKTARERAKRAYARV